MAAINNIISVLSGTLILAVLAPLASGFIRRIKNMIRMRRGQGLFQYYFNVRKLFLKDEIISKNVSWIFYAAPVIVFASSLCALFMVLTAVKGPFAEYRLALLVAVLFVLGLGRFFLALAGLDAGSSFGGMGSSREMFISSFAEPAAIVAVFALCMVPGNAFKVSGLLAGVSLFMVTLAETSRIPVDNQETHLELTMVHEAMVLEYSGRSLALVELAAHIKQMVFFILLSWCFAMPLPIGIVVIGLVIALVEMSVAKMRLFRVVDFLSFSFLIALIAAIAAGFGY